MPSATTMAAARKRAAVVVGNALQTSMSKEPVAVDHGFGSCSLRIVSGRTSVAEFSYRGILLPSFPKRLIDGTRPSQLSWLIKDTIFAPVYRRGMPAGREWMAAPHMNGGEHA
ncbi:hypothetical protein [Novosphingobium sp.]|uniref:hypothetical protein n=1 Tax=Novosphingobium sp. TaxID=1874826 RepID=UPI0025F86704|nr:hypothetical protein [Novosphingobium sp.]